MMKSTFVLAALILLAGCAGVAAPDTCVRGEIRLSLDAPGAPESLCTRRGPGAFELHIIPEAEPINPSPWYAFALESDAGGRATVTLDYAAAGHRYNPWISEGGEDWVRLDSAAVSVAPDGEEARLDFDLAPGRLLVAAQPPYTLDHYEELRLRWAGNWRSIGSSVEGRPIEALIEAPQASDAGWILLLGRQHPPEVGGAWAFEAFAEALLERRAAGELAAGLIFIPVLNPDGVDRGHWRLNAGGVDLNRDWAARTQPETRAVFALLEALNIEPGSLELVVDFHSTVANRLYLPQRDELPRAKAERFEAWLEALAQDGVFATVDPRRTNPARRVSAKAVFTDEWAAPALTWEVGDEAPAAEARDIARRSAQLWTAARRE